MKPLNRDEPSAAVVVVVNDDVTQIKLLTALLRKEGIDVLPFLDAEAALKAMVQNRPPDLIITDLYMPGLDGWRFCRLLRSPEYQAFNQTPILVVSATFSGEEAARITADLGADAFLTSPIDAGRFIEHVHTLLGGKRSQHQLRVLIVEDSKTLTGILKKAFAAHGYWTETVLTVTAAVAAFSKSVWDVAVIDYHLPDGQGDALLHDFRAQQPDCVCIMMTTDPAPGLALSWMKKGAAAYLRKPFAPEYLIELCVKTRRERALLRVQDLLEMRTQELRESEQSLRLSEEQMLMAEQIGNTGSWIYNIETNKIWGSAEGLRIFGYPSVARDWPIDDIEACIPERERVHQALVALISEGREYNLEYAINPADGSSSKVIHSIARLEKDTQGNPHKILGFIQDITDRKQAEEALREEQQFSKLVLDNLPGIFYLYTYPENRMILWNKQHETLLGYTTEETKDKFVTDWHLPEHKEAVLSAVEEVIKKGQSSIDGVLIAKDGHLKPFSFTGVRFEARGRLYFMGIGLDTTDRHKAEEERRSLEERLQRAEKMEALGTLAGGVAHDLNNVLGVVVGYAELVLMKADESSSIRPQLVNIMNGGLKAAAIVDDLLTLARRGVSDREVLNLNKIIADCQKSPEFEKLYSYHPSVKIKTDIDPDLPNISGSSVHLGKSLYNLISNASEAMAKGGVVTIKTRNQYLDKPIQGYDQIREGDYVVLSVSDTGEGIQTTDLKRIFEPFYTKKVMGRSGTGLGLAVVWGTMKDHHGYINVESEEGKGSTFTLYFPVTREAITAEAVAIAISEYMGSGESILVVDDVKEQRDLAAGMLRTLNYSVTSVSSGEEAIAYLKDHQADLMVLDMIMDPGIDGLDTYRSILEIRPKQKAIIVSGFSETDRVKAARDLGAGAYVRKPYIKEKLGLAVRKEIGRSA